MSSEALNQRFLYIPKSALVASAVLHVVVLLCFVTVQVLDHFGITLFAKPSVAVKQVYQDFIQVDVVALPDQMFGEQFDVTQPVVEKPATSDEPLPDNESSQSATSEEMVEAEAEAEKKAAEEKSRKEAQAAKEKAQKVEQEKALKRLQEEARREAALKSLAQKSGTRGRSQLKGNKLSQGTATTGMIGSPADRYGALVKQAIQQHFSIYAWQKKKSLVAVVTIKIFPNGRVRDRRLVKASTDATFNSSVIQAIDAAQPLPVPEDLSLLEDEMTLEFRPEE